MTLVTTQSPALDTAELVDLAAQNAATADTNRRLDPDVVEAIREAGFARHFVSSEFGGAQGTFADLADAIVRVGASCSSSSWVASLSALGARFACHLPPAGRELLWGQSPDVFVSAGIVPAGTVKLSGDGFTADGVWRNVSGCDAADWFLLCARVVPGEPGAGLACSAHHAPPPGPPPMRFVAVRRDQVQITSSWEAIGMCATSTDTVTLNNVHVPESLTFDRADLIAGTNPTSTAPVHNVPFQGVGGLTFVAPLIGAARGAVADFAASLQGRTANQESRTALVRCSAMVDSAEALLDQNTRVLDDQDFTPERLARNERNAAVAADLCRQILNEIISCAGTFGLTSASPLQRRWRDVSVGASHIALRLGTAAIKTYPAAQGIQ